MAKWHKNLESLWKYNKRSGLWDHQRTVSSDNKYQWLTHFQSDEPDEHYHFSKTRPKHNPLKEDTMLNEAILVYRKIGVSSPSDREEINKHVNELNKKHGDGFFTTSHLRRTKLSSVFVKSGVPENIIIDAHNELKKKFGDNPGIKASERIKLPSITLNKEETMKKTVKLVEERKPRAFIAEAKEKLNSLREIAENEIFESIVDPIKGDSKVKWDSQNRDDHDADEDNDKIKKNINKYATTEHPLKANVTEDRQVISEISKKVLLNYVGKANSELYKKERDFKANKLNDKEDKKFKQRAKYSNKATDKIVPQNRAIYEETLEEARKNNEVDEHGMHDLVLYADNDSHVDKYSKQPILKSLKKKFDSGKYDHEKAIKAWEHHANYAAKKYHKDFKPVGEWHQHFNTATRRKAAEMFADAARDELNER